MIFLSIVHVIQLLQEMYYRFPKHFTARQFPLYDQDLQDFRLEMSLILRNLNANRDQTKSSWLCSKGGKKTTQSHNQICLIRPREVLLTGKIKVPSNLQLVTDHAVKSNDYF